MCSVSAENYVPASTERGMKTVVKRPSHPHVNQIKSAIQTMELSAVA